MKYLTRYPWSLRNLEFQQFPYNITRKKARGNLGRNKSGENAVFFESTSGYKLKLFKFVHYRTHSTFTTYSQITVVSGMSSSTYEKFYRSLSVRKAIHLKQNKNWP